MARPDAGQHVCPACLARGQGISYDDWLDEHLLAMHDKISPFGCTFTGAACVHPKVGSAVDGRGRFPGDDGYDPEHRLTQELLDR